MARGWEAKIGADTRDFEQGVKKGIIKPVDEAAKSLDDLADAGEDAGRDGARGLDRLEDALKDAQRQSEKTERAVEDIGDTGGRSFGRVREGAMEVQQEIGSNLGEAVSSLRGDISELGQVGQDTLGGLAATVAGTGPAGIVGAIGLAAGAAGWGAITGALEKQNEEAEKLRERLSDAYRTAAEEGDKYLGVAAVIADTNDLIYNPDRAEEYQKVLDTQKQTGLDMSTIFKANAGDLEAIETVRARLADVIQTEIDKNFEATGVQFQYSRELQKTEDHWRNVGTAAEESSQKSQEAARFTSDLLLEAIQQAGEVTEAVDEFGNRLVTLPSGKEVFIDANTGLARENLDDFEEDADGVIERISSKEAVLRIKGDVSEARRAADLLVGEISRRTARIKIGGSGSARQILGG